MTGKRTLAQAALGLALILAGAALAWYIGHSDAPGSNEAKFLAYFCLANSFLSFVMAWSFNPERIGIYIGAITLTLFLAIFGIELIAVAGAWAAPFGAAWFMSAIGGALIGAMIISERKR